MVEALMVAQKESNLQLTSDLIKIMYDYVKKLLNYKYSHAITVLSSRNHGYTEEDFIQEVLQLLVIDFKKKSFANLGKLKNYIKSVVSFHYLKEKRKYFYTKQRGGFICLSLDETYENSAKCLGDVLIAKESQSLSTEQYDLHNLMQKNLYICCHSHSYKVGPLKEFRKDRQGILLSVNQFIKVQRVYGLSETCKFYKNHGFYMTKTTFDEVSQSILNYAKDLDLLSFTDTDYCKVRKQLVDIDFKNYVQKSCDCGYTAVDAEFTDTSFWQCPVCGKIHEFNEESSIEETHCSTYKITREILKELEPRKLTLKV